jgi:hypothetical protein
VRHSLREVFNRIRSFFREDPLDQELKQEMASHLEMAMEENIRRGMSAEEARRQALVRFGGVQQSLELHRESTRIALARRLDAGFTFHLPHTEARLRLHNGRRADSRTRHSRQYHGL